MPAIKGDLGDVCVLQDPSQYPDNLLQLVPGDTWRKVELVHPVLNHHLHYSALSHMLHSGQ